MKTNACLSRSLAAPISATPASAARAVDSGTGFAAVKRGFLTCLLLCLVSPMALGQGDGDFRQKNVDEIIKRINGRLVRSIDSPKWKRDYALVGVNIEDLRKTLAEGGKIKSNPVKKHHGIVSDMLKERRIDFDAFYQAQLKLQSKRGKKAKRLINDVGLEMISRITPKAGALTPLTQARTKNAEIIRKQFAEIRSIDKAILYLDELMKSIKPSIRELTQRRNDLVPLLAQFNSLKAGFDGVYAGRFSGEAGGTIRFTVKGTSVSGTISGSYDGDPIRGRFSGIVDRFGYMDTTLSGTLTDSSPADLGTFSFSGSITGNVTGASAKGKWSGKNMWASLQGSWSVTRK